MVDTHWIVEDRRQVNIDNYESLKSLCSSFNVTPFSENAVCVVFAIQSGVIANHREGVICYNDNDNAITTYTREYLRFNEFRIGQRDGDIKDHISLDEIPCTRIVGLLLGFYEKSIVNRRKLHAR